jgi:hypothetical protein
LKKKTWEKFVVDLLEDYKENNKLLYAVIRNKTKPKTELCSILDKNENLVWTKDAFLRTWMEHSMELLNGSIDRKNYIIENRNIPEKIEVNIFNLETAMRQMKNNKSPEHDKLTTNTTKAARPIGKQ